MTLWNNATVFIIGGGPTIKDMPLELIHKERVVGVNDAFRLGSWVDVCWFGDNRWFDWNRKALLEFGGLKATCAPRAKNKPGIKWFARGRSNGICAKADTVSWNQNSGASAINYAYHMGANRVILLGFDMKRSEAGEEWWHNHHQLKGRNPNPYPRFLARFPRIKADADKLGLEIINATPGSVLDIFPMKTLEEVLFELKQERELHGSG